MGRQAVKPVQPAYQSLPTSGQHISTPQSGPWLAQSDFLDLKMMEREKSENVHLRFLRCDALEVAYDMIRAASVGSEVVLERARACIPGVYIARG